MLLRVDYIFSYWIFVWYLLYIFRITNKNPLIAFILGLIENMIVVVAMLYHGSKYTWIFFINILFFKIIPIYFLLKPSYYVFKSVNDIWVLIWVFFIYYIWIIANNVSIFAIYKKHIDSLINDKNETPFMGLVQKYIYNK
jgi:hypothetical protein